MTDLTGIFNELCERALKESDKHGGNKPSTPTPMPKAFSKFIEKNHSFTLAAKNLHRSLEISRWFIIVSQRTLSAIVDSDPDYKDLLQKKLSEIGHETDEVISALSDIKLNNESEHENFSIQIMLILNGISKRVDLLSINAEQLSRQHAIDVRKLFTIGSRTPPFDSSYPDLITHRLSIIQYLKSKINEIEVLTKTLEDIRIKRKFWRQNPFSILQKDPHRTDLSDNRKPSFIIGKKAWSVVGELSGRANVHTPPEPLDRLPKSPSPQHDMDRVREGSMSQTQMLKFKQKNDDLLEELNARTLAVNRAIDVLNDVSDLHLQMSSHLQIQNEISSTIHDDSWKTTEIIVSANVYLERAKKNFQSARLWKVLVPIIASVALLLIDRR